jgi:hypothetical protein
VIQKSFIYHKSAKGLDAIATRQHGLAPKLRSTLIMVDGKRNFQDLVKVCQTLGDAEQILGQLLDEGFIEPCGRAAPPRPAATSAPAPLAAATGRQTAGLVEAQRFVVRRLTDIMGPNAEQLCLRIEATRNVQDFEAAVSKAEGLLRQFVNSTIASEFMAQARARMPAA